MLNSLLQWWRTNEKDGRTHDGRKAHDCQRCRLKIYFGPDKAGQFIYCPRCRASVRLPGKPTKQWRPDSTLEHAL